MIGEIESVDTRRVAVHVADEAIPGIQVNQLVWIRSTYVNERIVGIVTRITRRALNDRLSADDEEKAEEFASGDIENSVLVELIGTWRIGTVVDYTRRDEKDVGVFRRSLDVVPSIGADVDVLLGDELTAFMRSLTAGCAAPLHLGSYAIAKNVPADVDGNRFFQRHVVVVGSTGSGKSYTVATILEQASGLNSPNVIVFDLHGEYTPLAGDQIQHLKIAGPADNATDENALFLPYWLFSYDEIEVFLLNRRDTNAPNQARAMTDCILAEKQAWRSGKVGVGENEEDEIDITVESPVPYKFSNLIRTLEDEKGCEKYCTTKDGKTKLATLTARLKSRMADRRLNFVFNESPKLLKRGWLDDLVRQLMGFGGTSRGIKIIDFSEVPSDVLPFATALVSRLVFSLQMWTPEEVRHPISLFCDEAHLYMADDMDGGVGGLSARSFSRIAREGRKYGLSLVVISQRPSELDKTIISQCGTFVAMRLTNAEDQNAIRRLFPDNMGSVAESLPVLDVGEAIVVGDACPVPSRIRIQRPSIRPKSPTIDVWSRWGGSEVKEFDVKRTIAAMRSQQRNEGRLK